MITQLKVENMSLKNKLETLTESIVPLETKDINTPDKEDRTTQFRIKKIKIIRPHNSSQ